MAKAKTIIIDKSNQELGYTDKAETITVTGSTNKIYTKGGKDKITLSGGKDNEINADSGTDTIIINKSANSGNKIYGGAGNDKIIVSAGSSNSFNGGAGNDIITIAKGSGNGNKVYGQDGKDKVTVSAGNSHTVDGGAGNDTITITKGSGDSIKIYGQDGADTIKVNAGKSHTIDAGADNDRITISAGGSHAVDGGAGNDTITIAKGSGDSIKIYGQDGTDTIKISAGKSHTIDGGAGNDKITVSARGSHTVDGGAGNDTITIAKGSGDSIKIFGQGGADTIKVSAGKLHTIDGGAGNDTITIAKGSVDSIKIYSQYGTDTIKISAGKSHTIEGGAGDDNITIAKGSGSGNKIYGQEGADTIKINAGGLHTIDGGADNDNITISAGSSHTVDGGANNDTITVTGGNKHVLRGGTGSDKYVINAKILKNTRLYVDQSDYNKNDADTLQLSKVKSTEVDYSFNGGTLTIKHKKNKGQIIISGWDKNPMSKVLFSDKKSMSAIDINEIVNPQSIENVININKSGTYNATDLSDTFRFSGTGWDATIIGLTNKDKLDFSLPDSRLKNSVVRGDDVQLTLTNGNTITLNKAAGKQIRLIDANGQEHYVTPVSQQSVIEKFVQSLDNTTTTAAYWAAHEAVNYASGGKFKTWDSLIDNFINDVENYGGTSDDDKGWNWVWNEEQNKYLQVPETSTDKFLKTYCGIDLTNADTGSITGYDAGGVTIKTAESIMPEKDTLSNAKYPASGSTTFDGMTMSWPNKSTLSDSEKIIVAGLNSYWIESALRLVKESYGISYNEKDVPSNLRKMKLVLFNNPNGQVASASATQLNINMCYQNNIDPDNENGYWKYDVYDSQGNVKSISGYLDRALAHEFTHAVMAANINPSLWNNLCTDNMFACIVEGLAQLTQGIDDEWFGDICKLSQKSNASTLKTALGNYTTDPDNYHYTGGYMLFRYLAKQVADNSWCSELPKGITKDYFFKNVTITSEASGVFDVLWHGGNRIANIDFKDDSHNVKVLANDLPNIIYVNGTENQVSADAGNDIILVKGGNKHEVSGGPGNDQIFIEKNAGTGIKAYGDAGDDNIEAYGCNNRVIIDGGDGNDKLTGGAGDDTLIGGTGNDTLAGSAGKDIFKYGNGDGHDTIADYKSEDDIIQISNGTIDRITYSDKDTVLTIGGGTLTVQNTLGQTITVQDKDGMDIDLKGLYEEAGTNSVTVRLDRDNVLFGFTASGISDFQAGTLQEDKKNSSLFITGNV